MENQDFVRFHKKMKAKERYEFVENKDYISFHKKMERVVGGTNLWRMKIKTLFASTKKWKPKSGTNSLKIKTLFGFHNFVKPKERYDFVENHKVI